MTDDILSRWDTALDLLNAVDGVTAYMTGKLPSVAADRLTPYAVLYPGLGTDGGERLAGIPRDSRTDLAIMLVGKTVVEVGWLAERVRPALRGVRLAAGDTPLYMAQPASRPVPDNDLIPPLYTATDVWTFAAPAVA